MDRIGKYWSGSYDENARAWHPDYTECFATREFAIDHALKMSKLWPTMFWSVKDVSVQPPFHVGFATNGTFIWNSKIKKGYDQ